MSVSGIYQDRNGDRLRDDESAESLVDAVPLMDFYLYSRSLKILSFLGN